MVLIKSSHFYLNQKLSLFQELLSDQIEPIPNQKAVATIKSPNELTLSRYLGEW